jgi:hypothetical protein
LRAALGVGEPVEGLALEVEQLAERFASLRARAAG